MKQIKLLLVALFLTTALSVSAVFERASWQYVSKINIKDAKDFVIVDIPAAVFEKLNANLSDFRIVDEDGEVPYATITGNSKNYISDLPSRMYNLATNLGRSTSFEVDIGAGLLHSTITIETASENFKRKVVVYGSTDANSWQTLNDKGQIFDYTNREGGFINSRFTNISYIEGTWRFLKVVIDDTGEPPLDITGVRVKRVLKENAREISYTPVQETIQNDKDKKTDVILDIGFAGVPHGGGELTTNDEIFSRGIIIYDSNDKKSWEAIGRGYIFSIDTPKFAGQNLRFDYPESRKKYIKVSILNMDDRPISITGATLFGVVRSVIFKYSAGKNYSLFMGNTKAESPRYDIEKLAQYVNAQGLPKATIGAIEQSKDYIAPPIPLSESSPYILPAFLILIVVILLFLVARLFSSTRKK